MDYHAPVDQLLRRGEPGDFGREWPNYLALGFGPEHVPELTRMLLDPALNEGDPESAEVWAPLHAWRVLGQLHAEAAIEPLLEMLRQEAERDGDYALEEVPTVLGMIGLPAIPAVTAFLRDQGEPQWARTTAATALKEVAARHPEARAECVAALSRQLEEATANDPTFNAFVMSSLLDLHAVEAAPVIEAAFGAGAVDESIAGDWPRVQWELGLTDKPPPERRYFEPGLPQLPLPPSPRPGKTARERAKARRKQAAKSRKRNRKKR
jgi:hypothetical protein